MFDVYVSGFLLNYAYVYLYLSWLIYLLSIFASMSVCISVCVLRTVCACFLINIIFLEQQSLPWWVEAIATNGNDDFGSSSMDKRVNLGSIVLDGSSEHVRHAYRKIDILKVKLKFDECCRDVNTCSTLHVQFSIYISVKHVHVHNTL